MRPEAVSPKRHGNFLGEEDATKLARHTAEAVLDASKDHFLKEDVVEWLVMRSHNPVPGRLCRQFQQQKGQALRGKQRQLQESDIP